MAVIAVLGLGAMGAPLAERLLAAGHEVAVWNRSPHKARPFAGRARVATSPAEAASGSEAVITMLSTPDVVREVLLGAGGVVHAPGGPPPVVLEMSTIGPDAVAALAADLPAGVALVDAPVLGSVSNAADGTLKVFVGATPERFAAWAPVLEAFGTPVHLGPTGAGAAMKLVANGTLAALMATIGEALALGDRLGLDEERMLTALGESPIGTALNRKRDKIESGRYGASFKLSLMHKDIGLALAAASARGLDLPLAQAVDDLLALAEQRGFGPLDYSALVATARGGTARP